MRGMEPRRCLAAPEEGPLAKFLSLPPSLSILMSFLAVPLVLSQIFLLIEAFVYKPPKGVAALGWKR